MAATLLSNILTNNSSVPHHYIRPISDHPNLTQVHYTDCPVSFIDLQSLEGPDRTLVLNQIAEACQKGSLFRVSRHFFRLPESEKMKNFSDDPSKTMRLSTSFNMKRESVHNWRDYLSLRYYPLQDFNDAWPSTPERKTYSLGLEGDKIEKALGKQGQHMAINYYPPCRTEGSKRASGWPSDP
ncbi:hypothetical protein AMTRI_Chr09g16810 [Amborella trichopoda]